MMSGFDVGSFLLGVLVVLLVFLAIDLLVAGGGISMGMIGGIAGMMATPWGWLLLLLVVLVAFQLCTYASGEEPGGQPGGAMPGPLVGTPGWQRERIRA